MARASRAPARDCEGGGWVSTHGDSGFAALCPQAAPCSWRRGLLGVSRQREALNTFRGLGAQPPNTPFVMAFSSVGPWGRWAQPSRAASAAYVAGCGAGGGMAWPAAASHGGNECNFSFCIDAARGAPRPRPCAECKRWPWGDESIEAKAKRQPKKDARRVCAATAVP